MHGSRNARRGCARGGSRRAGEARPGRGRLAGALLAVVVGLAAGNRSAPAASGTGPGRIAVGGVFPTGYVGLLARCGLPREVLLDYQFTDRESLSRYDLVIVAGLPPGVIQQAIPALGRLVESGGSVLFDYSYPGARLVELWGAQRPIGIRPGANLAGMTTRAPFRLVGEENPLRQDVGNVGTFVSSRIGFVPAITDPDNTTVLAEYVDIAGPGARQARVARQPAGAAPDEVPVGGAPAIILQRRRAGKIIFCGPGIGQGAALAGIDYDALILGMIRILTDGRAVPQLQPEGPHLGRRQSARSLGLADGSDHDPADGAPPAWPAGPGTPEKAPPGYMVIEEEPATEFNLSGRVQGGGGDLLLNHWGRQHCLRVWITATGIRIVRQQAGKSLSLASAPGAIAPGTGFLIKERRDRLTVTAGAHTATASIAGLHQGRIAARPAFSDVSYQPVEPPLFDDDFMRTSDDPGVWTTRGGAWRTASARNPDLGANPFSYRAETREPACALAGYAFWDEYRFSVAARPERPNGAVGLGVYAQDADNMLLFRARIRPGAPAVDDGFTLVRLVKGAPVTIARAAGGLAPNQWYRLEVKAQGPWVGAFVDGMKVLTAKDSTFPGGQIALRLEDTAARFDDARVRPAGSAPGESRDPLVAHVPPNAGIIDVDSWAGPATPWDADPAVPGLFWRRGIFPGDASIRLQVPPLPPGGEALLLLDGDGRSLDSGATLRLRRVGIAGYLELRRQGAAPMAALVPVDREMVLALRCEKGRLVGLVDDRAVLRAAYSPAAGQGQVAFRAVGFRPSIADVALWSAHVRDYTFDTAPVDWWVGSGEWDVTNRWSCTPDWSWFCGYSQGVADIWHKQALTGDVVLDFYAGPKMIEIGERKSERIADFNAVLCGDGERVESGYSFVVAGDGAGARILRRGQVVAENRVFRPFGAAHNRWANIRAEKRGASVQLFFEGQLLCRYEDPDPLRGGHAGIWTRGNGIMLPRITLYHEGPGQSQLR